MQTKKLKKGFGLMNKESVEVTAAVSERCDPEEAELYREPLARLDKELVKKLPATRQGDLYDKYVGLGGQAHGADCSSRSNRCARARHANAWK